MRSLPLRQNFAWTLFGQVVYAASQWGIITVLARQGNAAMVGEYALALAIAGPIVTFLNLKLRAVQASDAKNEYAFADYLGLRVLTSAVSVLVIILIAWFGDRSLDVRLTIMVMGIAKSFESLSDILFGLQQKHERMDLVARSMIAKGILSLAGFLLGFTVSGSVFGGTIGIAGSWLATLLLIDVPAARCTLRTTGTLDGPSSVKDLDPHFDRRVIRSLVAVTIPLGLTVTLGSLSTNIPRYFIEHFLGAGALGVFVAMIYPLTASNLVISALAQSATPRLAMSFQNGAIDAFKTLLGKLIAMGAVIGIVGVLVTIGLGRPLIGLFYGEEFVPHHAIFTWAMVNAAIGYMYVFLGTALNSMRKFKVQLPIHLISVTVLTLSCWMFLMTWELIGAMMALTLTALLEAVMYVTIVLATIRKSTSQSRRAEEESPAPLSDSMINGAPR